MEKTKKCPYCGEEIMADAKKCRHCGEWLDKPSESKPVDKTPSKNKKAWLYVAIAAVIVAVGVAVALFLPNNSAMPDEVAENQTAADTEKPSSQAIPFDRSLADHLIAVMRTKGYHITDGAQLMVIMEDELHLDKKAQTVIKESWMECLNKQKEIDNRKDNIYGRGDVVINDTQEFLAAEKKWNAEIAIFQKEIDEIKKTIESYIPEKN